jgi:hypothetical protein
MGIAVAHMSLWLLLRLAVQVFLPLLHRCCPRHRAAAFRRDLFNPWRTRCRYRPAALMNTRVAGMEEDERERPRGQPCSTASCTTVTCFKRGPRSWPTPPQLFRHLSRRAEGIPVFLEISSFRRNGPRALSVHPKAEATVGNGS